MRVLVTGASGFLGRHLLPALLDLGFEVRALSRTIPTFRDVENVEWIQGDLTCDDMRPIVSGCDAVIHLAAQMVGTASEQMRIAVNGTRFLLDAMSKQNIKRFVLASSFSVYDWNKIQHSLHDNSPLLDHHYQSDVGSYAVAKLAQERIVQDWSRENDAQVTILRPTSIWDKGHLPRYAIGQAVGPLLFVIAPSRRIHLIHVTNCAKSFAKAVSSQKTIGEMINLCDSDRVTAWEFAGLVAQNENRIRVPVPYLVGRIAATIAYGMHQLLRGRINIPSFLIPRQYIARFRVTNCSNDKMKRFFGWKAPNYFDYAQRHNKPE